MNIFDFFAAASFEYAVYSNLAATDLHALADGVCTMLHELIVEVMLLNVLKHVGLKCEVLVTLLIFERVKTGKYALSLGLYSVHAKEVVVEHMSCSTPIGCPGVCLDIAPCWVLSPVTEHDMEHGTVVCIEGQMAGAGVFQGLKIVEIVPLGSVLGEDGCTLDHLILVSSVGTISMPIWRVIPGAVEVSRIWWENPPANDICERSLAHATHIREDLSHLIESLGR